MKIYVDDQERPDFSDAPDAAAVLAGVRAGLSGDGRVITEIRVDGVTMDEEALLNVVGNPLVHFTSQSVRTLVRDALAEALEYAPRLTRGLEEIAAFFEENEIARGQARLAEAAEGLDWLLGVFQKCGALLAVGEETEGTGLTETEEALVAGINLLGVLHEEKKYPQMSLCIRQRLAPEIDKLSLHIRRLHDLTNSTQ
ncbi:MAG: hypothetical protein LBT15_05770 [Synergistaceae bacterium]|jgi:hypothetical protein|nr:hypothetical protein [Synergistaceae bacterium]